MTTYNIKALRGDTFKGVSFTLSIAGAPPTPIDLTGAIINMQVRKDYEANEKIIEWSTDDFSITIEGADNNVIVIQPQLIPATAPAFACVYDLQVNLAGVITTYVRGCFEIIKDVTKL